MRKIKARKLFKNREWIRLAGVLLLALLLRVWGIGFGLPDTFHADEPIVVNHAAAYGSGDLNPHFFKIPPLTSYVLAGLFGFLFVALRIFQAVHSVAEFQNLFFQDPTVFYLTGRIVLGALTATATVAALYLAVRRHFTKTHALIAAFLLAVNFLHARDAHFIYPDMPLLLCITASWFPVLRIATKGQARDYWLSGALLGIAVALKYNGVMIAVPFLAAHFLSGRKLLHRPLWEAGLLSLGVYTILNPFTWLDFKTFTQELAMQSSAAGYVGISHHAVYSIWEGAGLPSLAGLLGFLTLVAKKSKSGVWRKKWALGSFLIAYYVLLIFKSQPYDRYVLPLIPFIMFFAADFFVLNARKYNLKPAVLGLIVMAAALPQALKSARVADLLARDDIRTIAKIQIQGTISAGSRIALGTPFFCPRLQMTEEQLFEKRAEAAGSILQERRIDNMIEQSRRDGKRRYHLYFLKEGEFQGFFSRPVVDYDLAALRQSGVEYVVVPRIAPGFKEEFFSALESEGKLIARFSPYKDASRRWPIDGQPLTGAPFLWRELLERERNGQIIEVYEI